MCDYLWAVCVTSAYGDQKMVWDSLELETEVMIIVTHYVATGNWTWVFVEQYTFCCHSLFLYRRMNVDSIFFCFWLSSNRSIKRHWEKQNMANDS